MDAMQYLKTEIDKKLQQATDITETAGKAARSVTPDEKAQVERLISEATDLKAKVSDMEANAALKESIERMRGPVNQPADEAPADSRSLGDAFVKSDAYNALRAGFKNGQMGGNWTSGPVELPDFGAKTTLDSTGYTGSVPQVLPGIREATAVALRRLTVADLLAQGTTDSATVRYLREATHTNAADSVAEGADKPESAFTFDQVDEPVRKVATFLPVSDEMLEDESQIRSYLDQRLRLFVQHAEEAQLLAGSGTAPDISGIMDRTGVQTATRAALGTAAGNSAGASLLGDALFMAITNIRTNALTEPDGIVMHPTNWAQFRLAKDANEQYYGGGFITGAYGNGQIAGDTAWGLPVVVTTAITANTALVGAFGTMAQVFYRNQLTVEASNSHSDFFQKNLTAIRAERRLALAVYRPEAFHIITALQTA